MKNASGPLDTGTTRAAPRGPMRPPGTDRALQR